MMCAWFLVNEIWSSWATVGGSGGKVSGDVSVVLDVDGDLNDVEKEKRR